MQHRDRLIVLKTLKYSESDLIVHGLDVKGAALHFLAKGALRSKKRFGGGVLEPTHFIEVVFKRGKDSPDGTLHLLQEAHLLKGFEGLRKDYDKLQMALYFLQLVSHVSREGTLDSSGTFNLLGHALQAMETTTQPFWLKVQFELKFLYLQGVLEVDPSHAQFLSSSVRQDVTATHSSNEISSQELISISSRVQGLIRTYTGISFLETIGEKRC